MGVCLTHEGPWDFLFLADWQRRWSKTASKVDEAQTEQLTYGSLAGQRIDPINAAGLAYSVLGIVDFAFDLRLADVFPCRTSLSSPTGSL